MSGTFLMEHTRKHIGQHTSLITWHGTLSHGKILGNDWAAYAGSIWEATLINSTLPTTLLL